MKEHKNIDRLFQEKFRDFESLPPERIWSHVEKNINLKSQANNYSKWGWFAGIAVGLALLFLFNNPTSIQTPNSKEIEVSDLETLPVEKPVYIENNSPEIFDFSFKNPKIIPLRNRADSVTKTAISINYNSNNKIEFPALNPVKSIKEADTNEKEDLAVVQNSTDFESSNPIVEKKNMNKKWSISTVAAPIFSSSFNNDISSLDAQMDENKKQVMFSSAFGVQVAYQISKRFSVQSGIQKVDFAYRTNDINVYTDDTFSRLSNVNYDDYETDLNPVDNSKIAKTAASNVNKSSLENDKGFLTQMYGYIEIPLEAKYRLKADGNMGINIIGGFSTLLLNKNEIYLGDSEFTNKIGEASNLNSLNFSGNMGLEFEYKVFKNVNFNVVPMFKIQTQTLNNLNTFKPYSVGLYSGLNLRF